MLPVIICSLMFLMAGFIVAVILQPRTEVTPARIEDYLLSSPETPRISNQSFADRILLPILTLIGKAVMAFTPSGVIKKIHTKLDLAGNPRNYNVIEYVGAKVVSAGLIIPLGFFGLQFVELHWIFEWVAMGVIIGIGIWLPDIILQRIIEWRQISIRRSLPDVLDLLVVSVEAGIGFDGAVQKVVEKSKGPLQAELARVLEQVRLGKSRIDALREMGQRTQVPDLVSFVAAVTQAETLGISIANVLRTQACTARERRSQRARESAAKLPLKLLFPLVFFIFPSLFVVILGPGVIRFIELFKVLGK